jgi:hypothetical protein
MSLWKLQSCIVFTLVALGCGGEGQSTTEAGPFASEEAGRDVSGSEPSSCPSVPPATGDSCSSPGATCPYSGCTACVCESDGTWACPGGPGDCASCPMQVVAGASCDVSAGVVCIDWSFCGGSCSCYQGKWACSACAGGDCSCPALLGPSCRNDVCSPPMTTSCPDSMPHEGDSCSAPTTPCVYPWPAGCAQATCSCSNVHWTCSYQDTGCEDAG